MKEQINNAKIINKMVLLITGFVIVTTLFIYFSRPIATNSYFTYQSDPYNYNLIQD